MGTLSGEDVLKAAANADPKTDKEQRCEACCCLAMAHLLKLGSVQGDDPAAAAKAKDCLERFVASGVTNFVEYRAAKSEPERMER